MYKIIINNVTDKYDYNELIKIFLKPEEYVLCQADEEVETSEDLVTLNINDVANEDKNLIKRELYLKLSEVTNQRPAWGILTGVRPVKLTGELVEKHGSVEAVRNLLKDFYLLNDEKTNLLINTYNYQQEILGKAHENSVGVYIGIPFCPTRCLYCSFTSNQKGPEEIER